MYEVLRILQELKEINNLPKMPIMENVVDLVQAKFVKQWQGIQQEIEKLGYVNYQQTLNAKEYGIAQNRRRVFMVSILGDYNYNFPKGFELEYRLKDYLEDEVDDKYYLSDAMYGYLNSEHERFSRKEVFERNLKGKEDDIAATITTRETNVPTSTFIDMDLVEEDNYLLIPEATTRGYKEAYDGDGVYINRAHQKRGVVQKGMIQTLKTSGNDVGVVVNDLVIGSGQKNAFKGSIDGTCSTLTSAMGMGGGQTPMVTENNRLRIRKLTPIETGRLMGMQDNQIDKQGKVTSNAQMYKQHGNGIVAQVIGLIIGMAYYDDEIELREKVMANSHMWNKEKENK